MIYRYIHAKFWSDEKVRDLSIEGKLMFLYFLTNRHTNRVGLYELGMATILEDLGLDADPISDTLPIGYAEGIDRVKSGIRECSDANLVKIDTKRKVVWVRRMLLYQLGKNLTDRQWTEIRNCVAELPASEIVDSFCSFYGLEEQLSDLIEEKRRCREGIDRVSIGYTEGKLGVNSSKRKRKSKSKTNIACARARDESDATPRDPAPSAETRHHPPSTHPGNGADEPSQLASLFCSRLRNEDLETIVNIYNATIGVKTGKVTLTDKRRKQLTDFLIDQEVESVDSMERLFRRTAASPFLTGQVANGSGKPFRVNFTWILNGDRAREVMEGKYDG